MPPTDDSTDDSTDGASTTATTSRRITLSSGPEVDYRIIVEGSVEPQASADDADTITTLSEGIVQVSGFVGEGFSDEYAVVGPIRAFEIPDAATVTVDGEEKDPQSIVEEPGAELASALASQVTTTVAANAPSREEFSELKRQVESESDLPAHYPDLRQVNIAAAGADATGGEPIDDIFAAVADEGVEVQFPPGTYLVEGPLQLDDANLKVVGHESPTLIPTDRTEHAALLEMRGDGVALEGFEYDVTSCSYPPVFRSKRRTGSSSDSSSGAR